MSSKKAVLTLENKKKYLALILLIIVLDQISKMIIAKAMSLYETREIIRGFFRLWRVHNPGAVWGIFSNKWSGPVPKIITGLSILALLMVAYYFLKITAQCRLEIISFALVLGGALGNITDRLRLGYVVDFLDFYIKSKHWPTFNLADLCISTGVILLAWSIWRGKCSQL